MLCLRIPMLLPSLDCVTASEQASCTVSRGCEHLKMGCSAASMLSEKLSSQQGVLKTEVTHKSCFFSELPPAPSKRWCQKTGMQVLFCKSWTVMTLPLEVATRGMQNPSDENPLTEDNLRLGLSSVQGNSKLYHPGFLWSMEEKGIWPHQAFPCAKNPKSFKSMKMPNYHLSLTLFQQQQKNQGVLFFISFCYFLIFILEFCSLVLLMHELDAEFLWLESLLNWLSEEIRIAE